MRWGGNGASTYNWELGHDNADNDYYFEDFNFGALDNSADSDSTQFISDVKAAGSAPLMTMVMLPWVAQSPETSVHARRHRTMTTGAFPSPKTARSVASISTTPTRETASSLGRRLQQSYDLPQLLLPPIRTTPTSHLLDNHRQRVHRA